MKKLFLALGLGIAVIAGVAAAFATGDADNEVPEETADAVVLGEVDLAERAEILRNQYRRMTPGEDLLVQDVGIWPAAWNEFCPSWDAAPAERDLATWLVPFSVERIGLATIIRDANGTVLWNGTTDFAKDESEDVTLTGALMDESDWVLWEAARNEIERRLSDGGGLRDGEGGGDPSNGVFGLRFTNMWIDTNEDYHFDFAWESNGEVQVFCRAMHYECWTNFGVVTTNDENEVVTNDVVHWAQVPGERFNGTSDTWNLFGVATVTNGSGSLTDTNHVPEFDRVRFYAAAELVDTDGDGLTDGHEWLISHTDCENPDSDGDGIGDGAEVAMGFDPSNADDCPKVTIHATLYNPSGPDGGKEWVELYSASTRSVDLGGMQLEIGRPEGWDCAVVFPAGTLLTPGRCLLVGGNEVTNADIVVPQLNIPEPWNDAPDTGLRLAWSGSENGAVVDVVFIDGGEEFNDLGLDETGWLSTNGLRASAGEVLERRYPGVDTDRADDWTDVAGRPPRDSSMVPDFDGDGLSDGEEWTGSANPWGEPTNPWNADSDGDHLGDYDECVVHGTNPNTWATDGDIYPWMPAGTDVTNWPGSDSFELRTGWDPFDPDQNTNGIPDSWEMAFEAWELDIVGDADGDGVDNLSELAQNSNPMDATDTEEKPFSWMCESSCPGWLNGAADNDVGLGGWVKLRVMGASEGDCVAIGVTEGCTPEEFSLQWLGADADETTWSSGGMSALTVGWLSGDACLVVKDSAKHPNYTNSLGGEYLLTPYSADLDAMRVSHNAAAGVLRDAAEGFPGAFVPVNNDDDDYDPQHTPDKDQNGSIVGETDLLPIVLHSVRPSSVGGFYTLDIPAHVRIWQNPNRSGSVSPTTTFLATEEKTLYVEGVSQGSGDIKLNWQSALGSVPAIDRIRVTAFEWTGPLNVPDYSIHRYTASGAKTDSHWDTPVGGSIQEGSGTSDVRVFWGTGPVVGKAVFVATDDYAWDLEVNVVQVVVETPVHAFMAGIPFEDGIIQEEDTAYKIIFSGNPYGMQWRARITLTGPESDRGVDRMRIGFVQNMTSYQKSGIYRLDEIALVAVMDYELPLLDKQSETAGDVAWYSLDEDAVFFNVSSVNKTKTIQSDDTPYSGVPLTSSMGGNPPDATDDVLDDVLLLMGYSLDVCANTLDDRNCADTIYTRRATANWSFTGNGRLYQIPTNYTWFSTGACVTVPDSWTSVTNGSEPARVSGITANESLYTTTYTSQPWEPGP